MKKGLVSFFVPSFVSFLLTCLRMAELQAETCSLHLSVTNRVKTNLCCVRLNMCSSFSRILIIFTRLHGIHFISKLSFDAAACNNSYTVT